MTADGCNWRLSLRIESLFAPGRQQVTDLTNYLIDRGALLGFPHSSRAPRSRRPLGGVRRVASSIQATSEQAFALRLARYPRSRTAPRGKIVSVIDWLLDSDPAIRWQAMRDLTDAPADQVPAERARVATEGWGARLLALRREDGLWDTGTPGTEEITLLALLMLRDMGRDPSSEVARQAIGLVRDNATWHAGGPWRGTPLFAGEVEPCINGRVVAAGSYFGLDMTAVVERLLGEQMADGGWDCEEENGSAPGTVPTTIKRPPGPLG